MTISRCVASLDEAVAIMRGYHAQWTRIGAEGRAKGPERARRSLEYKLINEDRREHDRSPTLSRKRAGAVFVERSTQRWVVLDPEGKFWVLPAVDDPWLSRSPFHPTDETGLDPVPGHYKHVLGLPF